MQNLRGRFVVLVGRQRSGTTVLRKALATHPNIRDLGEVMHPAHQNGFYNEVKNRLSEDASSAVHGQWVNILIKTLQNLIEGDPPGLKYVVDIKYGMAQAFGVSFNGGRPSNALINSLGLGEAGLIHLIRRNKLELLVSERIAIKTNRWQLNNASESKEDISVHVSPITLASKLNQEAAQDDYFSRESASIENKATLYYEDLFANEGHFHPQTFLRLSEVFNVDPSGFDLQPSLLKQGRNMSKSISNFHEVRRAIEVLVKEGEIPPYYMDGLND